MKKEQPVSGCPWIYMFEITTSNFCRERGSYFFALLSMIIRSILTTSVSKETINVKNANMVMIASSLSIRLMITAFRIQFSTYELYQLIIRKW